MLHLKCGICKNLENRNFGDGQPKPDDDYPDFVVPLARAVAHGEVDRGVAICGSGVGACIAANKVPPSRQNCKSGRHGGTS